MRVNFMGLTGPQGVLPLYYSALVRERLRARDSALREFLDIFNHRAISLFYQAWEKFRFTVAYERGDDDRLSPHLMDLLGLGTAGLARIASRSPTKRWSSAADFWPPRRVRRRRCGCC